MWSPLRKGALKINISVLYFVGCDTEHGSKVSNKYAAVDSQRLCQQFLTSGQISETFCKSYFTVWDVLCVFCSMQTADGIKKWFKNKEFPLDSKSTGVHTSVISRHDSSIGDWGAKIPWTVVPTVLKYRRLQCCQHGTSPEVFTIPTQHRFKFLSELWFHSKTGPVRTFSWSSLRFD